MYIVLTALLGIFTFNMGLEPKLQTGQTIREVTFKSFTRGYSETIRITKDSSYYEIEGREKSLNEQQATTEKEWQSLLNSLAGLKLAEIDQLPAPTHHRERDAALHSQITVLTDSKELISQTFDDKNPPKPLKPLMSILEGLASALND